MKESTELNRFLGDVINGTVLSLRDGKFTGNDVVNYLPAASSSQEGLRGIKELGKEAQTATIAQNEAAKAELRNRLTGLEEIDRYYVVEGVHGLECIFRLIAKESYERGLEEGRAAALAGK